MSFLMLLPVIVVMRRRPEDIGLLPDGARPGGACARLTAGHASRPGREQTLLSDAVEFSWTLKGALRTRAFWLIVSTAILGTLASSGVGFSLVPYLYEEAGASRAQAVGVLSIGTVLAIANFGWGYLADLITPRRCLVIIMLATSAMTLYLVTVSSLLSAYIFGLLWGIFSGAVGTLEHMVLAHYFGRGSYGSILGMLSPLQTTALGLGPTLGAIFRDATGTYSSFYGRGVAYSRIGKDELAITDLGEAVRLDPNIAEAHFSLGDCYSNVGRLSDSIDEFGKCLRLDPEYGVALLSRGTTYALFGQHEAALKDLTEYLGMEPDNWIALHCRARVYLHLKNYSEAVTDFNDALEACPDLGKLASVTFFERGYCHSMVGEFQKAIDDYTRAIELDPRQSIVYVNRAIALSAIGDKEGTRRNIEVAVVEGLPREKAVQLAKELAL